MRSGATMHGIAMIVATGVLLAPCIAKAGMYSPHASEAAEHGKESFKQGKEAFMQGADHIMAGAESFIDGADALVEGHMKKAKTAKTHDQNSGGFMEEAKSFVEGADDLMEEHMHAPHAAAPHEKDAHAFLKGAEAFVEGVDDLVEGTMHAPHAAAPHYGEFMEGAKAFVEGADDLVEDHMHAPHAAMPHAKHAHAFTQGASDLLEGADELMEGGGGAHDGAPKGVHLSIPGVSLPSIPLPGDHTGGCPSICPSFCCTPEATPKGTPEHIAAAPMSAPAWPSSSGPSSNEAVNNTINYGGPVADTPGAVCGEVWQACCDNNMCSPGTACDPYYWAGNHFGGVRPTCVPCGGADAFEGWDGEEYRVGQLACDDGAPCEAGLVVKGCQNYYSAARCEPCGRKGETCCSATDTPCNGSLQCMQSPGYHGDGYCDECGGLSQEPCPEQKQGSNAGMCKDDLVARFPQATDYFNGAPWDFYSKKFCLPVVACGQGIGSECCATGPACMGNGTHAVTCVDGECALCGVRGTVPCDKGCEDGLVDVRGSCRGPDDTLCGQLDEDCCGADYFGPTDHGPRCERGLACEWGYYNYSSPAPSAAPSSDTASSLFEDSFAALFSGQVYTGRCTPCGGDREQACVDVRSGGQMCEEGLELGMDMECVPVCGALSGPPCHDEDEEDDYVTSSMTSTCPCKAGLLDTDGVCEPAPIRPSAAARTARAAAAPSESVFSQSAPNSSKPGTKTNPEATSGRVRRARVHSRERGERRPRRARDSREEHMERMRRAREDRLRPMRRPRDTA